jgi:isopropylmalate/homocitrate/citramalate synthase
MGSRKEGALEAKMSEGRDVLAEVKRIIKEQLDVDEKDIKPESSFIDDLGADSLGLVDTFGVLSPHAVPFLVRKTRERVSTPLETHFHMDFSLGVANTLMAVAAGAEIIQTTVTGLGERAGNTPFEDTVLSLLTMYDRDLGIRTEQLTALSRLVLSLASVSIPSNRPIVGERLFNVESGIITTWVKNASPDHLLECVDMVEQASGRKPKLTYSETNRVGDHICYYSDLRKLKSHYPDWDLTYSLERIVEEMVQTIVDLQRA